MKSFINASLVYLASGAAIALAADPTVTQQAKPPAAAIQDNSFLVEEAYNQEAGVVQHILNLKYDWNRQKGDDDEEWMMSFTQEWPVISQRHQFSYTLPFSYLSSGGKDHSGIGDIGLNYRVQALFETENLPAVAPRVSLILPTGSRRKDLGNGVFGYQFNLPVSKIVTDRWTVHFNAGATVYPDMHDRNPLGYNLGASVIYAATPTFNLMVESVAAYDEMATSRGNMQREFTTLISPGVRYAFNLSNAQLVVGAAAPIGLNSDAPDYGAFLYLSFEHRFLKEN
jgi:Putative MetA-pathway of phenol degradation